MRGDYTLKPLAKGIYNIGAQLVEHVTAPSDNTR